MDSDEIKALAKACDFTQQLDILDMLDEDDDEQVETIPRAPRRYVARDREGTATRLWNDYFSENPVFHGDHFRRRFRMSKSLFIRICQGIHNFSQEPIPSYFDYFKQRRDATGLLGFNIFQKCTSAIRQLAYGCAPDLFDEYLHMGEQTSYDCLDNFCKCVFHLYAHEYLRKPNEQDVQRLISKHAEIHGFPGMLGSIDCMHWAWKNCPVAWKGQYTRGDHGHPTIMLEAVASYDTWIWHAYFGPAGSNNDINVLNQSDLFNDLLKNQAPTCNFTVNGCNFTKGYYLADGIYPEWATLIKSFKQASDPKLKKFKRYQESARKDIERAFGILQGRFAIIKNPARPYYINKIRRIMYTCVVLHNMITEDNGRAMCGLEEDYTPIRRSRGLGINERVEEHIRIDREIRDSTVHRLLRDMLIEHIWNLPANFRVRNNPQVAGPSNAQEAGPSNAQEAGPSNAANEEEDEEEDDEDDEDEE